MNILIGYMTDPFRNTTLPIKEDTCVRKAPRRAIIGISRLTLFQVVFG